MRLAAGLVIGASACYSPSTPAGAPCDPALDNCPVGQACVTTSGGSFCGGITFEVDAGGGDDAAPTDAQAAGCYGTGIVRDLCLSPAPTSDLVVANDRAIDTGSIGDGNCDSLVPQPDGGAMLCLIAARNIVIAGTATLVGIGPNPLLLVASDTLTVDGTIDVASRLAPARVGAGAVVTCKSPDGGDANEDRGAGAGGAGGSFGAKGGNGGSGRQPTNNVPGAVAPPSVTPAALRGGCSGGAGGDGDGGGGSGGGGAGGGAVYLIAGTSITVTGIINASGAGGGPGTEGADASGAGGGGGSGGMIGLDAPSITATGQIFANGGGGGGGGGDASSNRGQPGLTAATALTAAAGGTGGAGGGGRGGNGSVLTTAPTNGANGSAQYCAGGGGGGGAGIIRVFGVPPSSLGPMVSPPPT